MNRTEYIGKLNALYVGKKNCLEELITAYLEELITAYDEKDKEIERLNKNIKELEEWLYDNTNYEEYDRVEKDTFNYVIKKIEELRNKEK